MFSDMHLRHVAPISRKEKGDLWYQVMFGYIKQLKEIAEMMNNTILFSGDLFHKWNSPAELINFAILELPKMYAIPGQHDLPYHNDNEITKSAYHSLTLAKTITNLYQPYCFGGSHRWATYPFSWNSEIGCKNSHWANADHNVALIHRYIWDSMANSYVGASQKQNVQSYAKCLEGFDVAFFGDNHKGFSSIIRRSNDIKDNTQIFNCGGFIRCNSDEKDYTPRVGVLCEHKGKLSVVPVYLDCRGDQWEESIVGALGDLKEKNNFDLEKWINILEDDNDNFDFSSILKEAVKRKDIPDKVRTSVLKLMEKAGV